MTSLAILLIGFSIFSAFTLALTHFRGEHYQDQALSRVMGLVLLLALVALQMAHFSWLYFGQEWVASIPYRMTLFAVAPAFFLFSRPLIRPQTDSIIRRSLPGHAIPVLISPFFPRELALPLAFVIGSGYLLWLAHGLHALRRERANFRLEMMMLGTVFAIALVVSGLGLVQAALPEKLFFSLYAIAIGLAFFLVQTTLALRPRLNVEIRETAQASYARSTLDKIDCEDTLTRLGALMETDRIYVDPDLSLPRLAERLKLSPHQLSELLNARLGKSLSRYLRELRVAAAKTMLRDEPSASVLSVGINVGFTSQSNFYEAFREIEGMTPGQFRKLNTRNDSAK
ncbi:MAG: helix-turn-helix domain-containing protein [Betaproteobacteria bacterium]|nr:helix-turn-helix domain-containing protein [Betaproteobacteria bacterium]